MVSLARRYPVLIAKGEEDSRFDRSQDSERGRQLGCRAKQKGLVNLTNPLLLLEAASGFEPLNKGFADLCLTTWLRRHA
jgi:hypothetical protein